MQSDTSLRDIRSLRRNRNGMAHNAVQNIRSAHNSNRTMMLSGSAGRGRSMKHRNVLGNSSSSSSNGSSTGNTSSYGGSRTRSLGLAERLLQLRKPRDDTYEGVESMHHSLARNVIASTTGRQTKNGSTSTAFRNPIFQMRYSKLVQDEENFISSEDPNQEAYTGVIVTSLLLKKMMKCLFILFITACCATLITMDYDANAKSTQIRLSQHEAKYQHHINRPSEMEQTLLELDAISNLTTGYDPLTEIPLFIDIKLTGSTAVKRSISKCFNLTMACELGLRQPNYNEEELAVFPSEYMGYTGFYVNVDTSTKKGLQRANKLNFTSSGLADAMSTPMLYEGKRVFREGQTKARMFTVFAHPIARSVGYYHYIQQATW